MSQNPNKIILYQITIFVAMKIIIVSCTGQSQGKGKGASSPFLSLITDEEYILRINLIQILHPSSIPTPIVSVSEPSSL